MVKTLLARAHVALAIAIGASALGCFENEPAKDPLPSWNDVTTKRKILMFVEHVTDRRGPAYVPEEARIAVFDHDGTLWAEKPRYFQLAFAFDRLRELAPGHPEWTKKQPFRAVLANDADRLGRITDADILKIVGATHGGVTEREFRVAAGEWLGSAHHPRFDVPYTGLVYQPMLELISYLHGRGFQVYICSAGGTAFMRAFADTVYGIPPERVIGSHTPVEYAWKDDEAVLMRKAGSPDPINDRAGKAVSIQRIVGRRPLLAVGNSDSDIQMLEFVDNPEGPTLSVLVHHDDADREFNYDTGAERALGLARSRGWLVVSVREAWRYVFPFHVPPPPVE